MLRILGKVVLRKHRLVDLNCLKSTRLEVDQNESNLVICFFDLLYGTESVTTERNGNTEYPRRTKVV